jgi:alkylation response protein AidB-like acyl-CoA dehydrogenase
VDFTLAPEQELLRDTARRLLGNECPSSLLRRHLEDRAVAGPSGLWSHLSEWTVLGGGPLVDLCLFLEECGAVCAPGPFFATTVLFAPLAAATGREAATGTVALAGASGTWTVNDDLVKTFVPDADLVEEVAVVVSGQTGPRVGWSERQALALREVTTLDRSRRVFEVVVPSALETAPVDPGLIEAIIERAWVASSAELLGTTRWLFDQALDYAKRRQQFGRPIGSFQALQHKLANMALAQQRAWAAVYYAAMTIDAGDRERRPAAHVAASSARRAAHLCATEAIQIHGGIGFTFEHDLHLWMRRAFAGERQFGPADWHEDRLADLVLV